MDIGLAERRIIERAAGRIIFRLVNRDPEIQRKTETAKRYICFSSSVGTVFIPAKLLAREVNPLLRGGGSSFELSFRVDGFSNIFTEISAARYKIAEHLTKFEMEFGLRILSNDQKFDTLRFFESSINVSDIYDADNSTASDINDILDCNSDLTTIKRLIDARLGQGQFRSDIIARDKACVLSGCDFHPILKASHIKPWRVCSDFERIDIENGILLIANVDAFFDRNLISFDDRGHILVSNFARPHLSVAGIDLNSTIALSNKQKEFMQYHRSFLK